MCMLTFTSDPLSTSLACLGPDGVQNGQQQFLILAATFGPHTIVNTLSVQFNMGRHDVLHDHLVPNNAAGQKELIGAQTGTCAFDQACNRLKGLHFHPQHEQSPILDISTQFLLHGLEQSVPVLVSINVRKHLNILGRRGAQNFENTLFVRSEPFSLAFFIDNFSILN